ncbi:MAG: hypothetical protein OXI34_17140 [Chloroflexota bacterium]|nr:hypothetical protein [Chloroflexota bacterium]MDE2946550.1 hypothetical protein [Chloroflexota bacterium]
MPILKIFTGLILLLTPLFAGSAQEDSGYTSTVNWFYSACEDRMVIDFSGAMQLGYDLYFQAFDSYGGVGEAITGLRRISVNGDYAVSQVLQWLNGETRALGTPISVVIRIGSESDPKSTLFQQPSDDVLGECEEPGSALVEGAEADAGPEMLSSSGVFTPDGNLLNPVYASPPESLVQIGARRSETDAPGRTANPGLIFAECRDVDGADPGLLYDTDEIILFWSWYAKTALQVRSHIDSAQYAVTLNNESFPIVHVSHIKQIPGSVDWWVFYTVKLGDKWRPGTYDINFALTWDNAITDGYEDFGPGTENERMDSGCQFTIEPNPYGLEFLHQQPTVPLSSYP